MTNWLTPDEIKTEINTIRSLTGDSGRISLIAITETDCPACEYNDLTHESKDSSCPTCNGRGKIPTESSVSLLAKIRWVNEIESVQEKIGYLPRGGVIFTIDINYESNVDTVDKGTPPGKIEIDGITVRITGKDYRGYKIRNRVRYYAESISTE